MAAKESSPPQWESNSAFMLDITIGRFYFRVLHELITPLSTLTVVFDYRSSAIVRGDQSIVRQESKIFSTFAPSRTQVLGTKSQPL